MNENTPFDLKCRACLSIEIQMNNLFRPFHRNLSLADILKTHTAIQVNEGDGLPAYICDSCTGKIIDFYNFAKAFQEAEKYLTSRILTKEDLTKHDLNNDTRIEIYEYDENIDVKFKDIADNVNKDEVYQAASEKVVTVQYSCEKCGDCCLLKSEFQKHMLQRHKIKVIDFENYSSDITITSPKYEKSFDCPVSEPAETNDMQCKKCNCILETSSDLVEHYKTHEKHICDQCGLAFTRKAYLRDHAEIHSSEKRHVCSICGKGYRRRNALVHHRKLHSTHLMCEACGQRFNNAETMKTHMKLKHTKERNFQCSDCGVSFAMRSWLSKHMLRRHNGKRERNHVCSICGIAYFEKITLTRHISIKHSEDSQKHPCVACGKHYSTRASLVKHFKNFHGLKTSTQESGSIIC